MPSPRSSEPTPAPSLQQRRDEIRRGLSRVNTAGIAVVLVTLALAVAAGLAALRAGRQTQLAREAHEVGREQLWQSSLAQARAGRLSRVVGSRAAGLEAIAAAAAIRPSVELRNEAIAHLAMLDFEPMPVRWTNQANLGHASVDRNLEQFLESDGYGNLRVSRIVDGSKTGTPTNRGNAFVLRGTNGQVSTASFSADGRLLCAVHGNRRAVVWDLAARTNAYRIEGLTWAQFSPEGDQLLVLLANGGVRLLEAGSGRELAAFAVGGRPSIGAFAFGGDEVAIVVENRLHLWNWRTGDAREPLETDRAIRSVAWHRHLLAAGDGTGEVRVWNLLTQRSRRLQAHQNAVPHLFFDPRGEVLVSTSYDGSTLVWEPRTGQRLLTTSLGFAMQFSPDGGRILFGTQSGWSLWRVVRPTGLLTLDCASGSSVNVWHADFSPDGRWLAATKDDGVGVFDAATGRKVFSQAINQARSAWFLPGGSNLLTTSTHRIAFWPITAGLSPQDAPGRFALGPRELVAVTGFTRIESGTPSFDRRWLVIPMTQTEAALFDLEARREVRRFTNAVLPKLSSISPDRRWVATGTFHGRGMELWDTATGQRLHQFLDGNCSAYFSPDGRYLVSAGSSHYHIYEPGTWARRGSIPRESGSDLPNLAAFSEDSRLLAAIKQLNRVELLAAGSWQVVAAFTPPDPQVVTWPVFSADGRRLAVATAQDLVQLWDLGLIRERLAAMGLDWNSAQPEAPAGLRAAPGGAAHGFGLSWTTHLMVPIAIGVVVVLGCALFIRARQRRLLAGYMAVDELAELQKAQLSRAQAELIHSQKMKALGNLAAGIAHDFNNLLSVIRMSNQLTGEAAAAARHAEIAENAAEVEQAVQQGKKLVRSMLGYSREDPEDNRPCSVPEVVEDTVGLLSKQFLGGLTLSLDLDRDSPLARASRSRIEQLLLNLIVNASEAMAGHGTLRIRVHPVQALPESLVLRPMPAARYVELMVADTGPGIAPQLLPHIFEPFFTTKHRGAERGTGLGLSTVYAMAEKDGLGIAVESQLGQGATFRVFVAVADGP